MPKCNWRYIAGAFVLIAAVGGSGVWVYHLDKPITEQTSAYKDDAPTEKVSLRLERIARALEAIENGQNSQENESRARRDLDAQEGVWRWAKWAVWVAGVQAILSLVGIAFVILTIHQGQAGLGAARRALRHARVANDLTRRTQRAWVSFAAPKITKVEAWDMGDEWSIVLSANIEISNTGDTPALAFFCSADHYEDVGDENREIITKFLEGKRSVAARTEGGRFIAPNSTTTEPLLSVGFGLPKIRDGKPVDRLSVLLCVATGYRTTESDGKAAQRMTAASYMVLQRNGHGTLHNMSIADLQNGITDAIAHPLATLDEMT